MAAQGVALAADIAQVDVDRGCSDTVFRVLPGYATATLFAAFIVVWVWKPFGDLSGFFEATGWLVIALLVLDAVIGVWRMERAK